MESDYDMRSTSDQFLIDLHQDWLVTIKLFGNTERSQKIIKSIEEEMKCRKLKPIDYGWVDPRTWESVNYQT